ncbi:YoaK family protein [Chryseobacterium sp. FH1]|uniref:YoaK family protein n=1 Tax=Chryseobacterium sp. FH1 TaxID=1233951 RepID=UPI0029351D79|nr:YoaK family protein [Chryseobacterium sp. FH1]
MASILSTVAGIVNIVGVLSVHVLTTNVTGHFAFFSEQLFLKSYDTSFIYLYYIFVFLLGAFLSGLIAESSVDKRSHTSYSIPLLIEISIMSSLGFSSFLPINGNQSLSIVISSALLLSMGLQNALVTRVSQSVVRTTHLTGLFTDLGTDLSKLFFRREKSESVKLNKSIFLKLTIIGCFFLGSTLGGFGYRYFELKTLFIPVFFLILALWYDRILFRFYTMKRRYKQSE